MNIPIEKPDNILRECYKEKCTNNMDIEQYKTDISNKKLII